MTPRFWSRFHAVAMAVWVLLLIPTLLWWSNSILWVLFASLYANFATHFGAWEAARAERRIDPHDPYGEN